MRCKVNKYKCEICMDINIQIYCGAQFHNLCVNFVTKSVLGMTCGDELRLLQAGMGKWEKSSRFSWKRPRAVCAVSLWTQIWNQEWTKLTQIFCRFWRNHFEFPGCKHGTNSGAGCSFSPLPSPEKISGQLENFSKLSIRKFHNKQKTPLPKN